MVTAAQLADAGLGRPAIAARVANGWLRRRHRGVYLVGPLETPSTAAMAAVLAYGDGALLSHYPAAVLWALRPAPAHTLHVTVVASGLKSRDGIRAHRTSHLHPADATRHHGIPVTSPARTLLDLATTLSPNSLARAANEARIHRLVTDHALNEQFERYPAHRGIRALKQAIETEPRLTRSEAERRLLELIRAARLPDPQTNVLVDRYEVDFLWPEHHLVVEVDGYAFRSMRRSFERDRRRDARLTAIGDRATRVTWRQINDEPEAVIATLAAQLAAPSPLVRSSTVSA
jgi:very-short-patch-repair endonuclease